MKTTGTEDNYYLCSVKDAATDTEKKTIQSLIKHKKTANVLRKEKNLGKQQCFQWHNLTFATTFLCFTNSQTIKKDIIMKYTHYLLIAMIGFSFTLTGCVSKKELVACQENNSMLTAQYQTTKEQLAVANSRVMSLEEQLAQAKKDYALLQKSLDKSLSNANQNNISIDKLVDQINESNQYIRHLVEVKSKSDSLNMVLTNNLTRSLSKEELKEVDVQVLKGVVYISLADNMLYKSGSYEINDRAAETLSKIAKIIMDYSDYDVLVEGNTDNVPITRENIRNNWDLSCLRASSVVQFLQNRYGVDPKRLTAGGRGEYNPLTTNNTETGKQRNRRTQIIITPKLDQFMELIDQAPDKD